MYNCVPSIIRREVVFRSTDTLPIQLLRGNIDQPIENSNQQYVHLSATAANVEDVVIAFLVVSANSVQCYCAITVFTYIIAIFALLFAALNVHIIDY